MFVALTYGSEMGMLKQQSIQCPRGHGQTEPIFVEDPFTDSLLVLNCKGYLDVYIYIHTQKRAYTA